MKKERKPICPNCKSDEFFIGFDSFVCFKCKEHYKKNQFFGTVIKTLSNQDYEIDYVLKKRGEK